MNRAIERLAEELGTLSAEEWAAVAQRHRRAGIRTDVDGNANDAYTGADGVDFCGSGTEVGTKADTGAGKL